jgi:hypothetical protein
MIPFAYLTDGQTVVFGRSINRCSLQEPRSGGSGQFGKGRSCASLRPRHTVLAAHDIQRLEDHMSERRLGNVDVPGEDSVFGIDTTCG